MPNPSNSDLVGEAKPDLDAFEHLLQVGDCPYLGELEKLVRYTREVAQQLEQAEQRESKHREASATTIRKMGAALDRSHAREKRYREALAEIIEDLDTPTTDTRWAVNRARAALTPDEGAE